MWRNAELKKDAKFHLSGSYGMALLTALIFVGVGFVINGIINTIFAGGTAQFVAFMTDLARNRVDAEGNLQLLPGDLENLRNVLVQLVRGSIVVGIVSLFIQQIVHNPLNISIQNWYVRNRETQMAPPIGLVFSHFFGNYMPLVLGTIWKNLWLLIWNLPTYALIVVMFVDFQRVGFEVENLATILEPQRVILYGVLFVVNIVFAIININRTIAYSMQDYLLADNPRMGARRSLNLSKKMMQGNKWHYIGLLLSFFGWMLLAGLIPVLGPILLTPYINQTLAELYGTLRSQAVARGDVSMEELGFVSNDDYYGNDGFNPYEQQNQFQNPGNYGPGPEGGFGNNQAQGNYPNQQIPRDFRDNPYRNDSDNQDDNR